MSINEKILRLQTEAADKKKELLKTPNIIIFGAGLAGKRVKHYFEENGVKISYFCDNDDKKWYKTIENAKVLPPNDLKNFETNSLKVIIASLWFLDISYQLDEMGVPYWILGIPDDFLEMKEHYNPHVINQYLDRLDKVYDLLDDEESKNIFASVVAYRLTKDPFIQKYSRYEQYAHPLVMPKSGDIILDGGAWRGDTAEQFLNALNQDCKVYSFEPAEANYKYLEEFIHQHDLSDKVIACKFALTASLSTVLMDTTEKTGQAYCLTNNGTEEVATISIDHFFYHQNRNVDLIKLDIEGSEIEALKGAIMTIRTYKPLLYICIYHKQEDLYEIPLFINDNFPECKYKFYVGHHRYGVRDTILYCLPNI